VHDVAAVAARVAHGQIHRGGKQRTAAARAYYLRAAEELHANGRRHEDAQNQAEQREKFAHANRKKNRPRRQPHKQRPAEISLETFRGSLSPCQQRSTPVRNNRISPMGMLTLLKNGAPTLMREPENHSEKTGNSVPDSTAIHETSKIKL